MIIEVAVVLAWTNTLPAPVVVAKAPPVDWEGMEARARAIVRDTCADDGDIAYRRLFLVAEIGALVRILPDYVPATVRDVIESEDP